MRIRLHAANTHALSHALEERTACFHDLQLTPCALRALAETPDSRLPLQRSKQCSDTAKHHHPESSLSIQHATCNALSNTTRPTSTVVTSNTRPE